MKIVKRRSVLIAIVVLSASIYNLGQSTVRPVVSERNVRAQLTFLAGDALQGRGSGTLFERIAAEYVGSQFMQFGLEPAGEIGWDGKPTFVQTVNVTRNTFSDPPVLTAGSSRLVHGKEMLVMRANTDAVTGALQKAVPGDKPSAGAAVLLSFPSGFAGNTTQAMNAMLAAGASIVMIEETAQIRGAWTGMAARPLSFTVPFTLAKPSAMVALSKDQAAAIAALSAGTMIEFKGTFGTPETRQTWNAMGKITGTDDAAGAILLSSHLDHLGVRDSQAGPDKIFNGADDDASGTVAVMELARAMAAGKKPKRTIFFICFGSEESGGLGSRYFVANMPFPKEELVANLQFEMIGRPDPKVKAEELWLTGYERSNLGPELAKRGAKIVQDPHPTENFFQRSDNYALAQQGIIAHTVSSFGLHTDYHRPSDELKTIDFAHMTRAIESMIGPIDWLVNYSFRPAWVEGKKP